MKRRIGAVESAMKYRQIVLLLTVLMVLFGAYALYKMPRQEFPQVTIRQGLVIGIYPGANSLKVEEQLSDAVEKYLFGFKEINKKKTYSISKDGMMIVFVELNDNVNNADEFWSKLGHGLNLFKNQLPSGVLALFANSDFGDTSALLITLESDKLSYRQLEDYLNLLENRLRRVESVSKIRHYGLQKEQISIYLESEKLTKYGINSSLLLANLFTQGFTTTSGSIENEEILAPIHISETYTNDEEIANQIIYSDPSGNIIRLKDVARVIREYPEPVNYITNNGEKCLLISMEMRDGNNIVEYGNEIDEVLKDFQTEIPEGITINRVADQPKVVGDSISAFLREFLFAIAAVILVTMLLLPFRVASVAATSIPITVFISLGIMYLGGIELNTVTLAALIVVLGMIVDNSIVIVDSYMEKLDQGMSRWNAAISSANGFFKAIFSATLAISITFFPLLFTLKGTFQDFVLLFPWTVTLSLGISLLVAMFLIPYLQYFFIKKGFHQSQSEDRKRPKSFLYIVQEFYEKWLERAFKNPRLTIGLGILSVLLGVVLFTLIPQRLMPIAERNQFAVEIYLPQGSTLRETAKVADSLEAILRIDNRIKSVTSFVGTSSPRFHTTYAPNLPAKNYAQFIVNTISNRATEDLLDEYSSAYANYFTNAYVRFKQIDYQPIPAPVEVRFSGEDYGDLKIAADTFMTKIRNKKGISWVRSNFGEMLPGVNVEIDPVEASRLGITKSAVAANLLMHFDGLPVTTLWEDNYPLIVKLKTEEKDNKGLAETDRVYIHSIVPGVSVPLRQIASVNPDFTQGQYVRRNGVRTLTVMADVDRNTNVNKIFPDVKKAAEECCLPNGVTVSYGGAYESDNETLPQILGGLIMSIFIIFLILLFHFRKISLALLVLLSSSLTLLGATIGGLVLGMDFGVTSILGIISLIGILVRNGIIMLDYAEELRIHKNMTAFDAAMEAGKRRMRPIFLTSAAASVGVIPMIISRSALWAPMGTVICFGTMISMIMLVMVMPVVYWMLFRNEDPNLKVSMESKRNGINMKPILLTALLIAGSFQFASAQNNYSLEQCKNLAIENNTQLKNAELELEASEEVKKAAFTKYFPAVDATGLVLRANDPLVNMDVPGGNLPVYDGNIANISTASQFAYFPGMSISMLDKGGLGMVTAVQPVFAGGRIANGNKLAKLGVEVNNSKVILSKNDVLQTTEAQYWQAVSLNEKMKTINTAMNLLDTIYKQANDAWQAGLISQNELLKVMLKQSDLKVNKLQLENGVRLSLMALCQFVGIEYDSTMILVDSVIVVNSPLSVYLEPEQALSSREEYKLLKQSVIAEELQTQIKTGEYMPEVGIGVCGYYTNLMGKSISNGLAFASIKVPISGLWEATHTIKEHQIKEEIARNNSQNNSELLLLQIQKVWNELIEAYKQIDVAKVSIGQAAENLEINRDNYNAGLVNISDMIEAQMLLQQAENRLIDSQVNYQLKLTSYLQATGRYQ